MHRIFTEPILCICVLLPLLLLFLKGQTLSVNGPFNFDGDIDVDAKADVKCEQSLINRSKCLSVFAFASPLVQC